MLILSPLGVYRDIIIPGTLSPVSSFQCESKSKVSRCIYDVTAAFSPWSWLAKHCNGYFGGGGHVYATPNDGSAIGS